MRTFFTNLHKLPLLLTLISPCLISYTNSAITKNKSLTKGFEEIVQAFKSYGDIRTSHDSKNRCVTWLLLELWDSISQSINMRMHTHTYCMHNCVGLTFFLSEVTSTMFSRPMRNAFYHVTRWCWRWCGGGRQTAVSHQHSVNCSQPVATPLRGSEGQSSRVELKEVQGPKYL